MELERRRGLRSGARGEEGVEGREHEKSKAKFGVLARSSPLYSCSLSLVFALLGRHAYGMLIYGDVRMPMYVCVDMCVCSCMSLMGMVMYVWTCVYARLCLYGYGHVWSCMCGHLCMLVYGHGGTFLSSWCFLWVPLLVTCQPSGDRTT